MGIMRWAFKASAGGLTLLAVVAIAPALAQDDRAPQPPPATAGLGAGADSTLAATEKQLERQRAFAKMRVRQDQRRYGKDDLAAAEEFYQAAAKNWRGDEARAALKTLTERFPELNRTGCAALYVAQWAQGPEREQLLRRAAERHGDCFYPNGAQVGAYARYLLAHHYREAGKPAEAERLLEQIRTNYPDAVTHDGRLLVAVIRAEGLSGKQLAPATQAAE